MGKPTGFLEFGRQAAGCVPPLERIKNFSEFRLPLSDAQRISQAARCMNCGVPFCQSGEVFGGMTSGCPLHNLIPEWNDEIYSGHGKEALSRLIKTNPFPEFTGRVCPALCEAACTCGMNGDPVTVHDNELYIIEKGFENGRMQPKIPKTRSGRRVAVVGSGPAGLAAAHRLNQRGHSVTVFERESRPGGLLMYGIPNMKLDKRIVERRIKLMQAEGITFVTGTDVGKDVPAEKLFKEYDAVILCCGAKKARDINVPGRDADGVLFAVDYLTAATKAALGETDTPCISAAGKDVVIVGGGDTGNDCVATAIRQGCRTVTQLEMTEKPPLSRAATNPWPQWPKVLKTDYGQEEAVALFGRDPRVYCTTVKEIEKDENGAVKAVKTVGLCREFDKSTGKYAFSEVSGSEETLPCGLLLIAAGFTGCEDAVLAAFGAKQSGRGCVATAEGGFATDMPGLFAAGDARRGQSLVVWAISEGVSCADEVDRFLV